MPWDPQETCMECDGVKDDHCLECQECDGDCTCDDEDEE